jgi:hypothetical protein
MKSFRSQNTNTRSNLFMMMNFVLSIATGIMLITLTEILKSKFLFLATTVFIFSWMLLGTFLIKKKFIESFEYEFDEKQIIRKNLKSGERSTYQTDQIKRYYIAYAYTTSHLSYIELVFEDEVVWKIFVPPFSFRQTKIYDELKKIIREIRTEKISDLSN